MSRGGMLCAKAGLALAFVLFGVSSTLTANTLPTFLVTGGVASNNGSQDLFFSFTGPSLSINGMAEEPPLPCGMSICGFAGDQVPIDTLLEGDMYASATAGGVFYPDLMLYGEVDLTGANLTIPNTINPVVVGPISFSGSLTACATGGECFGGVGTDVFNLNFVPSGTVTLSLGGPDSYGDYWFENVAYQPTEATEPSILGLLATELAAAAGFLLLQWKVYPGSLSR